MTASSLVYLAGVLGYIGFEFALLFQLSSLVEAIATITLYSTLAAIISLLLMEGVRLLSYPVHLVVSGAARLLDAVILKSDTTSRFYANASLKLSMIIQVAISLLIATLVLAIYIGPLAAGSLLIFLVPLIISIAVLGFIRALFSRLVVSLLILSIFQLGYYRAHFISTRQPQFIVSTTDGEETRANVLLSTSNGLIYVVENDLVRPTENLQAQGPLGLAVHVLSIAFSFGVGDAHFVPRLQIRKITGAPGYKTELRQLVSLPLLAAGVFNVVKVARKGGEVGAAGSGNDFSQIAKNLNDSISELPGFLTGLAYLAGIGLGILGILKIKDHVDNPTQTPLQHGAIRLTKPETKAGKPALDNRTNTDVAK